jgi:hypothetical protein
LELVQAVATSLNLVAEGTSTEVTSHNKYEWRSSDGRFRLFLQDQNGGVWRVELVDWPNPSRSELSKHAEAQIRKRVKISCSAS